MLVLLELLCMSTVRCDRAIYTYNLECKPCQLPAGRSGRCRPVPLAHLKVRSWVPRVHTG
jgi:hypothetical protein